MLYQTAKNPPRAAAAGAARAGRQAPAARPGRAACPGGLALYLLTLAAIAPVPVAHLRHLRLDLAVHPLHRPAARLANHRAARDPADGAVPGRSSAMNCSACGAAMEPAALSCPACRRLTHAAELEDLAKRAGAAWRIGDFALERTALGGIPRPPARRHRAAPHHSGAHRRDRPTALGIGRRARRAIGGRKCPWARVRCCSWR